MGRPIVWIAVTVALAGFGLLAGCCREHRIQVDGAHRSFRLHVPEGLPASAPVPLLLALHQFSDTPRGMERMTRFNELADEERFVVAYPRGKMRSWDTESDRDVDFLLALVDHLEATQPVDGRNVFVTGASAGAFMAQYLATRTDRIRAIAPVMGSLTAEQAEAWEPAAPLSVLVIHGVEDTVVPFAGGETFAGPGRPRPVFLSAPENAAWWADKLGCDDEPAETDFPGYTRIAYTCPEDTGAVTFYAVLNAGHTWPGGRNRYPAFIVGNASEALDASRVIWDFFHQRRIVD